MKKSPLLILVFGILLLFFIQSAGTLVESIYILDLMNSRLDAKVLGVLFFFVPLLFLPFFKKFARPLVWVLFGLLFISRGLIPYLSTSNRLLASGIATAACLSLFFLLITTRSSVDRWVSAGLALAVSLSTLLRAVGHGIEYSLTPAGAWVGWVLGLALGGSLALSDLKGKETTSAIRWKSHLSNTRYLPHPDPGVFFSFSSSGDRPLDRGQLHPDRWRSQPVVTPLGVGIHQPAKLA